MSLSRRDVILSAGAGALLAPSFAHGASNTSNLQGALQAALDAFFSGWSSGNWKPFLALCDDTMVFQFPVGDQRGRHAAPAGKRALTAWATSHQEKNNRITHSTIDLKLFAEDWVIICDRGSGTIEGAPYTGLHAIFMRANSSGNIVEFREYFGELA